MIDVERTRKLTSLIAVAGFLWSPASPVSADIMSECREEARLYEISPEQFDDYLDGCVLSRGGYTPAEAGEEYVTPPEAETGSSNMPAEPVSQESELVEVDANVTR